MSESNDSGQSKDTAAPADLEKEGKNKTQLVCQRCKSVVLQHGIASRVKKELYLPHMRHKKEQIDEGETLGDFWLLDDMFKFENVGFTHTVKNIKYLACADCEVGPIGLQDLDNPKEYYVALERVDHEN